MQGTTRFVLGGAVVAAMGHEILRTSCDGESDVPELPEFGRIVRHARDFLADGALTLLVLLLLFLGGLFVLLGWKFDVANVEAIPLILGIGIDDAVHVIHAVRRQFVARAPAARRCSRCGRGPWPIRRRTWVAPASVRRD